MHTIKNHLWPELPTYDDLIFNIILVYGWATPKEKADGLAWYKRARRAARAMARDMGIPLRHAVGSIAATSPNLAWSRNVKTARQVVKGYLVGLDPKDINGCCAYPAMRSKAYAILGGPNRSKAIMRTLNGPKITAFYDNIMGGDSVTVDGHARNIAYFNQVPLKGTTIGKAEYKRIALAYRDAASILGLKACDLQAITWTAWRRHHGIKV